jgi:chloramphenicol 3-O-phosphotransferase
VFTKIIHERLAGAETVGESPSMREVLGHIDNAAASRTGVLVSGEPGSGRGLVARAIHACANAGGAPFVAVECDTVLPAEAERQMWIPEGFAHGFLVTSDVTETVYRATDYYAPEHERTLFWNDPALGISWPLVEQPSLAAKDAAGVV